MATCTGRVPFTGLLASAQLLAAWRRLHCMHCRSSEGRTPKQTQGLSPSQLSQTAWVSTPASIRNCAAHCGPRRRVGVGKRRAALAGMALAPSQHVAMAALVHPTSFPCLKQPCTLSARTHLCTGAIGGDAVANPALGAGAAVGCAGFAGPEVGRNRFIVSQEIVGVLDALGRSQTCGQHDQKDWGAR